jgi:hypothetical protein
VVALLQVQVQVQSLNQCQIYRELLLSLRVHRKAVVWRRQVSPSHCALVLPLLTRIREPWAREWRWRAKAEQR